MCMVAYCVALPEVNIISEGGGLAHGPPMLWILTLSFANLHRQESDIVALTRSESCTRKSYVRSDTVDSLPAIVPYEGEPSLKAGEIFALNLSMSRSKLVFCCNLLSDNNKKYSSHSSLNV